MGRVLIYFSPASCVLGLILQQLWRLNLGLTFVTLWQKNTIHDCLSLAEVSKRWFALKFDRGFNWIESKADRLTVIVCGKNV